MKIKSKLLILIVFSLLFSSGNVLASNGINHYSKTININGVTRNVDVVEVNMNSGKFELEVAISHDKLGDAESFSSIVQRKEARAAINANFFHSYTHLEPIGLIAIDNEIIHLEGGEVTAGVTKEGSVLFTEEPTIIRGNLDNKHENEYVDNRMVFNLWSAWRINNLGTNSYDVALFTPHRGESIQLDAEGLAVTVENNLVTSIIDTPQRVQIPSNGYVIYYGSQSTGDYRSYVQERFALGRTVGYNYHSDFKEGNFWDEVEQAITAGPRLLRNGQTVLDEMSSGWEDKISTARAQRSALGVTANNELLLVTVPSVTITELAFIMQNLGTQDAMNLDGGASSALYYDNKIITRPGRNLSTVLIVKDKSLPEKADEIKVKINGSYLSFDVPPMIIEGRTVVPVRAIFESLGAKIHWQEETRTITGHRGYMEVKLTIDEELAYINGESIKLDVPATIIDGRTLVPARFIAESLGAEVGWDGETRTVTIDKYK